MTLQSTTDMNGRTAETAAFPPGSVQSGGAEAPAMLGKQPKDQARRGFSPRRGFTLIELLVVISVIAILAGLILGTAGYAITKGHTTRAQAELAAICAAIDSYKLKQGYYPPSNGNSSSTIPASTITNSLFYELTGTTNYAASSGTVTFVSSYTMETLANASSGPNTVNGLFGVAGLMNSSPDPTQVRNYFPGIRNDQHGSLYFTDHSGPTYTLMSLAVHGPHDLQGSSQILNFWHYVSSQNAAPQHNHDTYDLWVDIVVGGKTNRISNWSKDPEIVSDWQN